MYSNTLVGFFWQVLNNLLYLMRVAEKDVQSRVALAFAHLCKAGDRQVIFIEHKGRYFI